MTKQIFNMNTLPHNFLAEKLLLNCLIINPKFIESTNDLFSTDMFYFKNHQAFYNNLCRMSEKKLNINSLSFINFIQQNGTLEQIGGFKTIIEIINVDSNELYINEYILLLKEKYIRRRLIKFSYTIINSSYSSNIDLSSILTNLEKLILITSETSSTSKMFNSISLVNKLFDDLKKRALKKEFSGLTSGFKKLDLLTQGFQSSDLIILAGRPSVGKTAFSLNLLLNILKSTKQSVLFFSLEMSHEQLMHRLLSTETNINQVKLKTGQLKRMEWLKINKMMKILAKLPLFINDEPTLSIQNIRSVLKSFNSKKLSIGFIIIDYLQLIQNENFNGNNRTQELSYITRSLKLLAREFNVPILALSQLNRKVETRLDSKPLLADLRDSGSIEQDADLVLMLYKLHTTTTKFQNSYTKIGLQIAKHRNGPLGNVIFKFDPNQTKFLEI